MQIAFYPLSFSASVKTQPGKPGPQRTLLPLENLDSVPKVLRQLQNWTVPRNGLHWTYATDEYKNDNMRPQVVGSLLHEPFIREPASSYDSQSATVKIGNDQVRLYYRNCLSGDQSKSSITVGCKTVEIPYGTQRDQLEILLNIIGKDDELAKLDEIRKQLNAVRVEFVKSLKHYR